MYKMKLSSACFVLLATSIHGALSATADVSHPITNASITPFENRGGFVNPEDLIPMPQCIAEQDQSTWLGAMTKCTSKKCIKHFGVICTRHQWLTELSCLDTEFSPEVLGQYLPHCSRLVLAKAQLYRWIHSLAGRTWLVDFGDAYDVQNLSPASLADGYEAVGVMWRAPTCLINSVSSPSSESFQGVMASCGFQATTRHTGNADRPWEYNEGLHSITTLDSETIGYDMTGRSIYSGYYFDKKCFCDNFSIDPSHEPCSWRDTLDLTKERLWRNAICGPMSLPDNWKQGLKITGFSYIHVDNWKWPRCVTDLPQQIREFSRECTTSACEVDSRGYCNAVPTVDRACFCRNIDYDSCGGSCHMFETRINYVNWLHGVCGDVPNWHGLPENLRQLGPTASDMIPWEWTLKPSNNSQTDPNLPAEPIEIEEICPSAESRVWSLALVNVATFLAALLSRKKTVRRLVRRFLYNSESWHWLFSGGSIAAQHLFVNYLNSIIIRNIRGYEHIPVSDLILFWCSMPRLTWLAILFARGQSLSSLKSAISSFLFAEVILQVMTSSYMIMTVTYGLEHRFYFGALGTMDMASQAKAMYAGALLWLVVIIVTLVAILLVACGTTGCTKASIAKTSMQHGNQDTTNGMEEGLMTSFNDLWTYLEVNMTEHIMAASESLEYTPLMSNKHGNYVGYGAIPLGNSGKRILSGSYVKLYTISTTSMLFLWIAQWLFWAGFTGLSLEEFCPPKLEILTVVWMASSLVGVLIGAT